MVLFSISFHQGGPKTKCPIDQNWLFPFLLLNKTTFKHQFWSFGFWSQMKRAEVGISYVGETIQSL